MRKIFWLVALILSVQVSLRAQELVDLTSEQEKQAQEIFHSTMSPYCPGRLLSDCPSTKANELKRSVRRQVFDGRSIPEIRANLNERYGEDALRAAPKDKRMGLLAWMIPSVFFAAGLFGLFRWLRGMEEPASISSEIEGEPTNLEQRIRKDLGDR